MYDCKHCGGGLVVVFYGGRVKHVDPHTGFWEDGVDVVDHRYKEATIECGDCGSDVRDQYLDFPHIHPAGIGNSVKGLW